MNLTNPAKLHNDAFPCGGNGNTNAPVCPSLTVCGAAALTVIGIQAMGMDSADHVYIVNAGHMGPTVCHESWGMCGSCRIRILNQNQLNLSIHKPAAHPSLLFILNFLD